MHQAQTELVYLPICPKPNNTLEQNVKRSRRHAMTWHFPETQFPVIKSQSCSKYACALGTTGCWSHHFHSTFENKGTQEARWHFATFISSSQAKCPPKYRCCLNWQSSSNQMHSNCTPSHVGGT